MSFDENDESPDRMVQPGKPTTKVNLAMIAAVLILWILGLVALVLVARR